MLLANETPFSMERFAIFDKAGAENLVVVLKGTFEVAHRETPAIAKKQDPIVPVDQYAGEPGVSSVLVEGDHTPPKPGGGVVVTGCAVAREPSSEPVTVSVCVGDVSQSAVVYGNRQWDKVLGLARITRAEPFARMPLTWENAFGGTDQTHEARKHWEWQADNPVGKGFLARKTAKPLAGTPLPNLERSEHLVRGPRDRPAPVGFGPVAPGWQPRARFVGTYDEKWREERAPLLPDDFDARFYQTAPGGLSSTKYFAGGESCVIIGMTDDQRLEFHLPKLQPHFRLCWPTGAISLQPRLDTVHVDTEKMKLHLIWRGAQEIHGRLESLDRVEASLNGKGPA